MIKEYIINSTIIITKKKENSNGNKYIKDKNKQRKFFSIRLNVIEYYIKTFLLIIVLVSLPIKVYTQRKINLGSSYIILKTYITGNVKILSDNYFTNQIKPSEIWINGLNKSEIKNEYYFNEFNNIINLTFNDNQINASCMFKDCSNLKEIDLSHFYASKITNMDSMFQRCTSLHSIDLSKLIHQRLKK